MMPYAEVIGDPISQSKSPLIHGFWLEALGISGRYQASHVRPEDLPSFIEGRRSDPAWRGCNVTIPHKQAILPLLDEIDARAKSVGAVNTVWRDPAGIVRGTNTDVDGVAEAIAGADIAGRPVVVIGAGGAARAAFAVLAQSEASEVRVLARTIDKAVQAAGECGLSAKVLPFDGDAQAFDDAALVINATQLGMTGQSPMPSFVLDGLARAARDALVFDMVYAPLETALLATARSGALACSDGLVMLVGQAATAFERFFGAAPPREKDAALRGILLA